MESVPARTPLPLPLPPSWNLLNEPRCKYCGPDAVNGWTAAAAAALKGLGVKQLVTTGQEGFFDDSSTYAYANPNNLWGGRTGQSFDANHAGELAQPPARVLGCA